jgi:hypothetical protein
MTCFREPRYFSVGRDARFFSFILPGTLGHFLGTLPSDRVVSDRTHQPTRLIRTVEKKGQESRLRLDNFLDGAA